MAISAIPPIDKKNVCHFQSISIDPNILKIILSNLFIKNSWDAQRGDILLTIPSPMRFLSLITSEKPPNIIFLGKPAAGKGTISKQLAKRYNYRHISIGDIHRHENKIGSPIGLFIRKLVQENKINSKEMAELSYVLIDRLFHERSNQLKINYSFILDNYPTTLLHMPYMKYILQKYRLKVIVLVPLISDDKSIERLQNRRVCSKYECGKSYNLKFLPPKLPEKCDNCGSKLEIRIDDTKAAILGKKLPFFHKFILPVIKAFSLINIELYAINNLSGLLKKYLNLL